MNDFIKFIAFSNLKYRQFTPIKLSNWRAYQREISQIIWLLPKYRLNHMEISDEIDSIRLKPNEFVSISSVPPSANSLCSANYYWNFRLIWKTKQNNFVNSMQLVAKNGVLCPHCCVSLKPNLEIRKRIVLRCWNVLF